MIRYFRAFAWMRWRITLHAFRPRGGRDALTRAATIGAAVLPWVLLLLLVPAAIVAGVLGGLGGWALPGEERIARAVMLVARMVLFVLLAGVIVAPVIRSMHGQSSSVTRLLLLPIPRRALLLSEIGAGLADPWILIVLSAIVSFCIALTLRAGVAVGAVAAAASGGYLASLLCLSAAVNFVVQLLFRDRRRGEVLTLVGAVCLASAGLIPALLSRAVEKDAATKQGVRLMLRDGEGGIVARAAQVVPSELWVRAVRARVDGRTLESVAALGGLLLAAAVLYAGASAAHRRLLDSPPEGSVRRGTRRAIPDLRRLPGLSDAASAVAWVHARALLRTLSGRMAVFFNPFLLLILTVVVFPRLTREISWSRFGVERSVLLTMGGGVFTLIALGRVLLNQFAADGAGFTLQLLQPIRELDLVRGKLAAGSMLGALSFGIFLVFEVPLSGGVPVWSLLSILLALASAYLLFAPVAALLSAVFPKKADLDRLGQASNPHGLANFAGFLLAISSCAPPIALYVLGFVLGLAPAAICALVAVWAALAFASSIPLCNVAAAALEARRESVAAAAQGR